MPVAGPDGRVMGVVTESDIVRTLIAGKRLEGLTAGEVMTGTPITVEVETPIEDVMKHRPAMSAQHDQCGLISGDGLHLGSNRLELRRTRSARFNYRRSSLAQRKFPE